MRRSSSLSGFTLLELLVTTSLVAGIIAVVLACFSGGLRVYERVRDSGTRSAEVYLAGESWSQDLYAIIPSGEYTFDHNQMTFFRYSRLDQTIREVGYKAPDAGGLYYSSSVVGDFGSSTDTEMIPAEMDVSFWFCKPESSTMWLETWEQGTNLPHAVQMRVVGEDEEVVERTIVFVHTTQGEEDPSGEATQ